MSVSLGKALVTAGLLLVMAGIVLQLKVAWPAWLGHLPGDIMVQKKNFSFYFPFTSCLLISLIVSVLLHLLRK